MDYFDRIASEWSERAPEIADRVMANLVNRTDVWAGTLTGRQTSPAAPSPFPLRTRGARYSLTRTRYASTFEHDSLRGNWEFIVRRAT
jgi:hypothetical protein